MRTFPASFPQTICFFWLSFVFFSGFLPVLRTICRWEPSPHPFPKLFDFFLIVFCFFLRVFASFENNLQMRTVPASFSQTIWFFSDYFLFFLRVFASFEDNLQMKTFPTSFPQTIWFFSDYFLFFSQGFWQFWEQSADENLPCILSPNYLIFFWLFFESWFCLYYFLFFGFVFLLFFFDFGLNPCFWSLWSLRVHNPKHRLRMLTGRRPSTWNWPNWRASKVFPYLRVLRHHKVPGGPKRLGQTKRPGGWDDHLTLGGWAPRTWWFSGS